MDLLERKKVGTSEKIRHSGDTNGGDMPLARECVVCTRLLRVPGRADRRYCGSSCRVRAFRSRRDRSTPKSAHGRPVLVAPARKLGSLVEDTREQLALFRDLRQARRRAAELTVQLAQAKKAAEQQGSEWEQERQNLQGSLVAAQKEGALLATQLSEVKAQAAAHVETAAQAAERLRLEQQRAAERIDELERAASIADTAQRNTLEQHQGALASAQRQITDLDAARAAAETLAQTQWEAAEAAIQERGREKKHADAAQEDLAGFWISANAELDERNRMLTVQLQQSAAEQEQTRTLQASLAEATSTVREQRDQLDETALALTEARAAAAPAALTEKLVQAETALAKAQKELGSHAHLLDVNQQAIASVMKILRDTQQKLKNAEAELSSQKIVVEELKQDLANKKAFIAEFHPKAVKLYEQILRIKEKKDWRL